MKMPYELMALHTKARVVELSASEQEEYDTLLRKWVMERNREALTYLSRKSDEDKRTDFTSEDWT